MEMMSVKMSKMKAMERSAVAAEALEVVLSVVLPSDLPHPTRPEMDEMDEEDEDQTKVEAEIDEVEVTHPDQDLLVETRVRLIAVQIHRRIEVGIERRISC